MTVTPLRIVRRVGYTVLEIADRVRDEADTYRFLEELRWKGAPRCCHGASENVRYVKPANGTTRRTSSGSMSQRRVQHQEVERYRAHAAPHEARRRQAPHLQADQRLVPRRSRDCGLKSVYPHLDARAVCTEVVGSGRVVVVNDPASHLHPCMLPVRPEVWTRDPGVFDGFLRLHEERFSSHGAVRVIGVKRINLVSDCA